MMDQLSHGQILPCGKSGTVTTGDVLESEEMVAPPHKVLVPRKKRMKERKKKKERKTKS